MSHGEICSGESCGHQFKEYLLLYVLQLVVSKNTNMFDVFHKLNLPTSNLNLISFYFDYVLAFFSEKISSIKK